MKKVLHTLKKILSQGYNIAKRLLLNWPWFLPMFLMIAVFIVWKYTIIDQSDKISISVLLGTAIIYSLQFINMRQSSKNQEVILKQQCNIAKKQHEFEIFTLRMNLRNELIKAFTIALSSEDLTITNDVNIHLVNIGKICDDIKFAFPRNKELDKIIKLFKNSCAKITKLAPEKQVIIECKLYKDDRYVRMRYKDCLEVYARENEIEEIVINPRKVLDLQISEKEKTILFGIMKKYILVSTTKDGLDDYIFRLFQREMSLGNARLTQICNMLDKDIQL